MDSGPMPATEASILERLLDPEPQELTPEAARYFLNLDLLPADRKGLQQLVDKASTGPLTPDERTELQDFERVNSLLFRVKTKARELLSEGSSVTPTPQLPPGAEQPSPASSDIAPGILC